MAWVVLKPFSHERATIQYYQRGESHYVDRIKHNIHCNDLQNCKDEEKTLKNKANLS